MTINNLKISDERLRNICQKYLVKELAVFGSALTSDFRNDSDIDLLNIFHDKAEHSLFSKVRMKEEFEELFGRPVDLISRRAIENNRNLYKRKAILENLKIIYAA